MVLKSGNYVMIVSLISIMVLITLSFAASEINPPIPGEGNLTNNSIRITNFAFDPQNLNVTINSSVIWTNEDSAPHTIVTDTDATSEIKSENLNKEDSFMFNFTKVGVYPYHCGIHPSMKGLIMVNP